MDYEALKPTIPQNIQTYIEAQNRVHLRPSQAKAIAAGLFQHENLLVCTPTGSGKTYVAELGFLETILNKKKKAIYIVPLKALAAEKYREFTKQYGDKMRIAKSVGDKDSADNFLASYDLIITTSEKLDSLIRHSAPWLTQVGLVIVDEIHQLNDANRGPTLEIVITILRTIIKDMQLIGLSATIGNPEKLAEWLNAKLVYDEWRPTELKKGIHYNGEITFFEKK